MGRPKLPQRRSRGDGLSVLLSVRLSKEEHALLERVRSAREKELTVGGAKVTLLVSALVRDLVEREAVRLGVSK